MVEPQDAAKRRGSILPWSLGGLESARSRLNAQLKPQIEKEREMVGQSCPTPQTYILQLRVEASDGQVSYVEGRR